MNTDKGGKRADDCERLRERFRERSQLKYHKLAEFTTANFPFLENTSTFSWPFVQVQTIPSVGDPPILSRMLSSPVTGTMILNKRQTSERILNMFQSKVLEAPPIQAIASGLPEKGIASRSKDAARKELEAPQDDTLAVFNALILQFQDSAYNYAFYLLGDPDSAADATQQAFINAYLHFNQFQGTNFRSWLFKILKNTCIDELRRTKRRNAFSLSAFEDNENITAETLRLSGNLPNPEQAVDQKEASKQIQAAIRRMDEPFRSVLILVDIQGMDYQEAAQVISVPLGTLKSRLARARQQFRRTIEQ